MSILYIIRGLPGSGKTTFAKKFNLPVFEADDWFTDINGNYNFIPAQIGLAHKYCLEATTQCLLANQSCVVANTFSRKWEIEPYLDIARRLNVKVHLIEMKGNFQSVHNVPKNTIEAMKKRWEIVSII